MFILIMKVIHLLLLILCKIGCFLLFGGVLTNLIEGKLVPQLTVVFEKCFSAALGMASTDEESAVGVSLI